MNPWHCRTQSYKILKMSVVSRAKEKETEHSVYQSGEATVYDSIMLMHAIILHLQL